MSDVEEALAWVVGVHRGDEMTARLHGMGDGTVVRRTVDVLPARVLFAGAARVGGDDMGEVVGSKGKLPPKWADSLDDVVGNKDDMEVNDDGASSVEGQLRLPPRGHKRYGERIGALEAALNRVAEMVEMLVAAKRLAKPAERLAVEKYKGKMAWAWDESLS